LKPVAHIALRFLSADATHIDATGRSNLDNCQISTNWRADGEPPRTNASSAGYIRVGRLSTQLLIRAVARQVYRSDADGSVDFDIPLIVLVAGHLFEEPSILLEAMKVPAFV
jgi:hypothetical protein